MVFALARRFVDAWGSLAAAATFGALSTHSSTLGYAGHATHFVVLFALGGLLLLPRAARDRPVSALRALACGLLLGLAVLMKQVGAVFVVFAVHQLIEFFRVHPLDVSFDLARIVTIVRIRRRCASTAILP